MSIHGQTSKHSKSETNFDGLIGIRVVSFIEYTYTILLEDARAGEFRNVETRIFAAQSFLSDFVSFPREEHKVSNWYIPIATDGLSLTQLPQSSKIQANCNTGQIIYIAYKSLTSWSYKLRRSRYKRNNGFLYRSVLAFERKRRDSHQAQRPGLWSNYAVNQILANGHRTVVAILVERFTLRTMKLVREVVFFYINCLKIFFKTFRARSCFYI